MRRGFTLIELLVATGVFLFGFTATYAMFIAGTRARVQADAILRLSIATSSLIEEFKLEAGREDASVPANVTRMPYAPSAYVGSGFANFTDTTPPTTLADRKLYRYPLQPGIWYRVLSCVDEKGDATDQKATALQMELLALWNPAPDDTMTMDDIRKRQRIDQQSGWPSTADAQVQFIADYLAGRGMAVRERVILVRKASWER